MAPITSLSTLFFLSLSFVPILCTPQSLFRRWDDVSNKHSWSGVPAGWELDSIPPKDSLINIRLGLKKHNFNELLIHINEISNPTHERYGQHLSKAEVEALAAPHEDTYSLVESWMKHHAVEGSHDRSGWINIQTTISNAERMLGTSYGLYRHSQSKDQVILRTLSYSLPNELHQHIELVHPTTHFGSARSMFKMQADNGQSKLNVTVLRNLYKTMSYKPNSELNNTFAVAGFLDVFASHADLASFLNTSRPDIQNPEEYKFDVVSINDGQNDESFPSSEATLDMQYAVGLTYPMRVQFMSVGGRANETTEFTPDSNIPDTSNVEPFLTWVDHLLAQDTIPNVISVSFGDDEQVMPPEYAQRVCDGFAQLGARGASVLVASGDSGVGEGDCKTNDGRNQTAFLPIFPATCGFVTSVGSTTRVKPEMGSDFSGGGFSNYFPMPDYQKNATSPFLKNLGTTYQGLYNASGRAYPDLSAQGEDYPIILLDKAFTTSGTSASTPTVAAVIALLNDFRISNGQPPLGFLNPLIYAHADAFNDIKSGNNPGCESDGFSAQVGWDALTGLGTPDFMKLKDVVSRL